MPASTFWPRSTGIFDHAPIDARRHVDARAVGLALNEQRCRHREVPDGKSEDRQDDQRDDDGGAATALFRCRPGCRWPRRLRRWLRLCRRLDGLDRLPAGGVRGVLLLRRLCTLGGRIQPSRRPCLGCRLDDIDRRLTLRTRAPSLQLRLYSLWGRCLPWRLRFIGWWVDLFDGCLPGEYENSRPRAPSCYWRAGNRQPCPRRRNVACDSRSRDPRKSRVLGAPQRAGGADRERGLQGIRNYPQIKSAAVRL